jgi:ketopantoate reductase
VEKFLFIAGVGGVTALARSGIGPLLASPEGHLLLTTACEEIAAIAPEVALPADALDRVIQQAGALPPTGDRRWPETSQTAVGSRSRP